MELVSVSVAIWIAVIAYNSREKENNPLLFLGVAYAFVGGIDFLHTLVYDGMNIIPGYSANISIQLWIIARYMESISLLIFSIFEGKIDWRKTLFSYLSLTAFLVYITVFTELFPVCFVENTGLTSFKIINEYVIVVILIITLVIFKYKENYFNINIFNNLFISIIFTIISELFFTRYLSLYGTANALGHLAKFISIYFVYKAIVAASIKEPYQLLASKLNREKEKVHQNEITLKTFGQLSHEIKTPLNLIFTSLQMQTLYINDLNSDLKLKFKKNNTIIKQNSFRLLRLVNNIIDLTKIKSGTYNSKFYTRVSPFF